MDEAIANSRDPKLNEKVWDDTEEVCIIVESGRASEATESTKIVRGS